MTSSGAANATPEYCCGPCRRKLGPSTGFTPLAVHIALRKTVELLIRGLLLVEVLLKERSRSRCGELLGPRDQRPLARHFVMLDGLRRRDQGRVQHALVIDLAGDVSASSMMPSIAGQSTPLTSTPCILNTCSTRLTWFLSRRDGSGRPA